MSSGNQGWGQAPPFARGIVQADDHPLAVVPPTNNDDNTAGNNSPTRHAPSSGPSHPLVSTPNQGITTSLPPPPPPVVAAAPVSAPVMKPTPPARTLSGSAGKPLEELADDFLSYPSYRTETLGLEPLLRPVPLSRNEDGIVKLRTLVERRAWGDVLKMATTMLNDPESQYSGVYSSLVTLPLNSPCPPDTSTIPLEIRQETVEIMMLQCNSWLKLRRYNDLGAEVENWNFLTQNDATAQSPDWLPWSM
jgi:hypothetical protein